MYFPFELSNIKLQLFKTIGIQTKSKSNMIKLFISKIIQLILNMIQRITFQNLLNCAKHQFTLKLIGQMHMFHRSPSLREFLGFKKSSNYIQMMTINWINQINMSYKPEIEDDKYNLPKIEFEHIDLYFNTLNKIIDNQMESYIAKETSYLNQYDKQQKFSCLRQQIEKNMRRMLHLEIKKNSNQCQQYKNIYALSQRILFQYSFLAQQIKKTIATFDYTVKKMNEQGEIIGIIEEIEDKINEFTKDQISHLPIHSQIKDQMKRLFSKKGELNFTPYLSSQMTNSQESFKKETQQQRQFGICFIPSEITQLILLNLYQYHKKRNGQQFDLFERRYKSIFLVQSPQEMGKNVSMQLIATLNTYILNDSVIFFANYQELRQKQIVIQRIFEGCWYQLAPWNISKLEKLYNEDHKNGEYLLFQIIKAFNICIYRIAGSKPRIIIDQISNYLGDCLKHLDDRIPQQKILCDREKFFYQFFSMLTVQNLIVIYGSSINFSTESAYQTIARQYDNNFHSQRRLDGFTPTQAQYLLKVWFNHGKNRQLEQGNKSMYQIQDRYLKVSQLIKSHLFQKKVYNFIPVLMMTDLIKAASLLIGDVFQDKFQKIKQDSTQTVWQQFSIDFWNKVTQIKINKLLQKIGNWILDANNNKQSMMTTTEKVCIVQQLLRNGYICLGDLQYSSFKIYFPLFLCDYNGILFNHLKCIQKTLYSLFIQQYKTQFNHQGIQRRLQSLKQSNQHMDTQQELEILGAFLKQAFIATIYSETFILNKIISQKHMKRPFSEKNQNQIQINVINLIQPSKLGISFDIFAEITKQIKSNKGKDGSYEFYFLPNIKLRMCDAIYINVANDKQLQDFKNETSNYSIENQAKINCSILFIEIGVSKQDKLKQQSRSSLKNYSQRFSKKFNIFKSSHLIFTNLKMQTKSKKVEQNQNLIIDSTELNSNVNQEKIYTAIQNHYQLIQKQASQKSKQKGKYQLIQIIC